MLNFRRDDSVYRAIEKDIELRIYVSLIYGECCKQLPLSWKVSYYERTKQRTNLPTGTKEIIFASLKES